MPPCVCTPLYSVHTRRTERAWRGSNYDRDPHELCRLARGGGGWVVSGTMNPSPSTDRQYIDFGAFFNIKPVLMPVLHVGAPLKGSVLGTE